MASKFVTRAVILWMTLSCSHGSLMYLGISPVKVNTSEDCNNIPGLVPEQMDLCKKYPDLIQYVSEGAKMAIEECQRVFEFERWNCSLSDDYSVFGPIVNKGTRETAFIHSILSAGVTYSVTKYLISHTCYENDKEAEKSEVGCKENISFAMDFSRKFVDAPEVLKRKDKQSILRILNIHNNKLGRRLIIKESRQCWPKLLLFQSVGSSLKKKYDRSVSPSGYCYTRKCLKIVQAHFEVGQKHKSLIKAVILRVSTRKLEAKSRGERVKNVWLNKDKMLFIDKSPSFCDADPKEGITGTRGRKCNARGFGDEKCGHLCCGRGYTTEIVKYSEICKCKFFWCCDLKCQQCERSYMQHSCL